MRHQNSHKIFYLLCTLIILIGVIIAGTASPSQISGNGNPMIIFIPILILIAIWFGFEWIKWIAGLFKANKSKMVVILIVSILIIAAGVYLTVLSFQKFQLSIMDSALKKFGDTTARDNFVNYVTRGLNQYTNSLYFNYITFLMYISLLNLSGITIGSIKKRKE